MDVSEFVGNPDVWAEQRPDGTYVPHRAPINPVLLARHLEGAISAGTYVLKFDKARFFVFDDDNKDLAMARTLANECNRQGFAPFIEFSGSKGYHVWVLLDGWYPAADVQRVAKGIAQTVGFTGEVFPKQAQAKDLGNLVKLPLGVHAVTKERSKFLRVGTTAGSGVFTRALASAPELKRMAMPGGATDGFPYTCVHSIQTDSPGDGERNNCMYQFVAMMRRGGLEGDALRAAAMELNTTFTPPLREDEVDAILYTTEESRGPICDRLDPSRRCGEYCVTLKKGIAVRPGELKHAAPGEVVVVELGEGHGNTVELKHPDIEAGLVRYRRGERPEGN